MAQQFWTTPPWRRIAPWFQGFDGALAIGSGGFWGKGFMQGTQTHLEFIPERTTDFIFASFSEEFGLFSNLALMAGFGVVQKVLFSGNTGVPMPPSKDRDISCDRGIVGGLFGPRWVRRAESAADRTQGA